MEEVFGKSLVTTPDAQSQTKNPVMVAAGKKAAITRATGVYTYEQHINGKPDLMKEIAAAVQEFTLALDPAIQEMPKKLYVAYKISKNIHTMVVGKHGIVLYLTLDPTEIKDPPANARDVRKIGHWGTGDFEIELKTMDDFEAAKKFIELAYRKVGG